MLASALLIPLSASAQTASPHAIEVPAWFSETFLDLREDVREAATEGKRLMIYFGQDGCPYCRALMQTNFTQPRLVQKTRSNFVALALNIWGDREVTGLDGRAMPEKELARVLRVQFTPTVLFLDEKGNVVARLNGYYPPHRFEAALDYVADRLESKQPFASYMKDAVKDAAADKLHDEPFFMRPPYDLRRVSGSKPLAVIFETPYCSGCDELHKEGFTRAEVKAELERFDVARFALGERGAVITPAGEKLRAEEWARAHRALRRGRARSDSHPGVPATVSSRGSVSVCVLARLSRRAIISAVHEGARGTHEPGRTRGRSVEVSCRLSDAPAAHALLFS